MKRRLAREFSLKALFMIEVGRIEPKSALSYLLENTSFSGKETLFCRQLVFGTLEAQESLDQLLSHYLLNWKMERLAPAVRNILRMGFYELIYMEDIPSSVTINESIELAKKYQDEESARFINGVLDRYLKVIEEKTAKKKD